MPWSGSVIIRDLGRVASNEDRGPPPRGAGDPDAVGSASSWERRGAPGCQTLRTFDAWSPFGPLDDLELHVVAFGQGAEALRDDGGVMHEHVLAPVLRDEAEPLGIIEPLDRALRHCCNLLKGEPAGSGETPALVAGEKRPQ